MITSVQDLMNDNTIVATIRNRDSDRIRTLFESCRKCGITSQILIADFGSYSDYSQEYESICKELNIIYVKTETEGQPWSRGQALNFGISRAKTAYITTTDIDMLFDSNPYEWIFLNLKEHNVFTITSYWLPKNNDKHKAKSAGKSACGGFLCIRSSTFSALGTYDPKIKYWGMEDLDLTNRLKRTGNEPCWLPENIKCTIDGTLKQKKAFKTRYRQIRHIKTILYECKLPVLVTPREYALSKHDRPILSYVKKNELIGTRKPVSISFLIIRLMIALNQLNLLILVKQVLLFTST